MKHIKFAIFTLILFSISSAFGQKDTSHFSVSTIGIEFNTLGSSRRFIQVPHSVANSSFYQDNFKNFGNENREFSILRMGTQIGGTVGVKFNFIKKIDAQLSIGLGYQNSSKYRDSVVKEVTDYDASGIPFTFQKSSIRMDYKFHEFYFSSTFLIKKKVKTFHLFSGFGVNVLFSKPKILVEEIYENERINKYQAEIKSRKFLSYYIPVGMEFNLSKKIKWRFNISLRAERRNQIHIDLRYFSSLGTSFIYQL